MTWDDTDRTELDKHIDEIEENAYQLGMTVGKYSEQKKLIDLIESMNQSTTTSLGSLVWTKHLIDKIEGNV